MAIFRVGRKIGNNLDLERLSLEVEKCKLEKFGSEYRDIFKTKDLDNLYCLTFHIF